MSKQKYFKTQVTAGGVQGRYTDITTVRFEDPQSVPKTADPIRSYKLISIVLEYSTNAGAVSDSGTTVMLLSEAALAI